MKTNPNFIVLGAVLTCLAFFSTLAISKEVEVLHWWTSSSEAKAMANLKDNVTQQGITWKDFAVAGGGGNNAMTALKARILSGNPPTAAQIKGKGLKEWGEENVLQNLDNLAKEQDWDQLLLPAVAETMKYKNSYVAVPVGIHQINVLWVSTGAFEKAGVTIPQKISSWEDFFALADQLKEKGITAVAHGGQPWQDATLFEAVALSLGGPQYYRDAFVNLDPAALDSVITQKVFETARKIATYFHKGSSGIGWHKATGMLINEEAGMQIMGDFAKGEFASAGKVAGKDYLCLALPEYQGFIYNIDSLAMLKQKNNDTEAMKAQEILAQAVMDPEFQKTFSLNKGSIPARKNIKPDEFDLCAQKAMKNMEQASKNGSLVPSLAHNMAAAPAVEGAMLDVIAQFMHSNMPSDEAAKKLAKAVAIP